MTRVDTGLELPRFRSVGGQAFRKAVLDTHLAPVYWRVAPLVHQYRRYRSSDHVDYPIDPFELVLVHPDRITRFTGREFPVWTDRWADFGAVANGDWDEREVPPVDPSYSGPDPSLYLADTFSETPLHQALRKHFVDGVPWEELPFVEAMMRKARKTESSVWHQCSTVPEVRQRCRDLDQLYRSMRDRGCLSMRELNTREEPSLTFREVMEHEIIVDVARDGEPLFVTGRHRLSLAKILGLERIPIAVAVRHLEWVEQVERSHSTGTPRSDRTPSDSTLGEPLNVPW